VRAMTFGSKIFGIFEGGNPTGRHVCLAISGATLKGEIISVSNDFLVLQDAKGMKAYVSLESIHAVYDQNFTR
jgi:hypothetical protein